MSSGLRYVDVLYGFLTSLDLDGQLLDVVKRTGRS